MKSQKASLRPMRLAPAVPPPPPSRRCIDDTAESMDATVSEGAPSSVANQSSFVDYYCEVGVGCRLTPSGAGPTKDKAPEEVLLTTAFQPVVHACLPANEWPDKSFTPEVAMFVFPVRCEIHSTMQPVCVYTCVCGVAYT